jgi:hypothetical protein
MELEMLISILFVVIQSLIIADETFWGSCCETFHGRN